jgi:LPP20 lipoprotein
MMKGKQRFLVLGIIMSVFLIMACATTQKPQPAPTPEEAQCIPDWTVNPPSAEDGVYGSGLAKMNQAAMSKTSADQRARQEVVMAIEVKVQAMVKDFMQQSGIGDAAQSLMFASSVSKGISSQVLHGCKIVKRKVCSDGTWHSLALWPIGNANELKKEINNKAKKEAQNKEALYNEFKAKNGFADLQKELDKLDFTEN